MAVFNQDTVCIVTGASRGIGRSIAKSFASEWKKYKARATFVLIARSVSGLEETREHILQAYRRVEDYQQPAVQVHLLPCDLGDLSAVAKTSLEMAVILRKCSQYKNAVLVHNAGSVGDVSKYSYQLSATDVSSYFNFNVASFVQLTSSFMAFSFESKLIVNITSILSTLPLEGTALYGAGKAAREHHLRVLAKEVPSLRVLMYSPGPCDTAMHEELRTKWVKEDLRSSAQTAYKDGQVLDVDVSVAKLVSVLTEDKFENAQMVDYFDGKPMGV